jgi:chorismate mutase
MATFAPVHGSGSTSGRMVKVAATATPGTTLHTAVGGANDFDEIVIAAMNSDSVPRLLTIELGGTTDPDDLIEMTIPAQDGLHIVVPKGAVRMNGGLTIAAFAATADVIVCTVTVDRRTA